MGPSSLAPGAPSALLAGAGVHVCPSDMPWWRWQRGLTPVTLGGAVCGTPGEVTAGGDTVSQEGMKLPLKSQITKFRIN